METIFERVEIVINYQSVYYLQSDSLDTRYKLGFRFALISELSETEAKNDYDSDRVGFLMNQTVSLIFDHF